MRNNQPITNRESVMGDGTMIVSKTDTKGRIEFVNQDFIDISGFTKEELIGQPHNLIRHPDMPEEAFEDMWRDLKAGLPWSGYVKNRVKNGDHYWVHANAMPVVENNQTTGYISIRSKPDAATIRAVDTVYRQFKEGKAKGLAIKHGRVVDQSRSARVKRFFERLSAKVVLMGAALCIMVMLVGAVGIFVANQTTNSLRTVYEDRTVTAGQLADIRGLLYGMILELNLTASGQKDLASLTQTLGHDIPEMEKIWTAYMATYLTPEEKILAERYTQEQKKFLEEGVKPALELAKAGKLEELHKFLINVDIFFEEAKETNHKLVQLQLDVAKAEYTLSKAHSATGFWMTLGVIVLGVAVAFFASRYVQKILRERLLYVDARLHSIAGGNFTTQIDVKDDELFSTLITIRALQAKLAYAELEKKEAEQEKAAMQEKLAHDFEQSVKHIVNVVAAAATELSQTAGGMVSMVAESSHKTTDASGAAANTSANVQSVAAAAEELSASVREISSQIQKTTTLVAESKSKTVNADGLANALSKASDRVTGAMDMIGAIAGQIKLLALNATIESARAGEAGKGFAVVASEVKSLANQTDKTVGEIQAVVKEMREASQAIIAVLTEIGASVGSISEATSSVASAVEEQSAVTNEIAKNMQTAAAGTQTISNNLQEVQASSTHASVASEQMLMATKDLSQQAENLNVQVDEFLRKVRS